MKKLSPIYNYASDQLQFKLRDRHGHPVSLNDTDSVYLRAKESLGSSTLLFVSEATVLDSTSGWVEFNVSTFDTTHSPVDLFLELRVSGSGVERVLGQYEGSLLPSLTRPSFYNEDPQYGTHVIIEGDVLNAEEHNDILDSADYIITDAEAFFYLPPQYKEKCLLRFNLYAHDRLLSYGEDDVFPDYIGGPGNYSMGTRQNPNGEYVYVFEDTFQYIFILNIRWFLEDYGSDIQGVVIDNFYPDIGLHWLMENGEDLEAWPDRTDDSGDLVPNWNQARLSAIESAVLDDVNTYAKGGMLLLGGPGGVLEGSKRFAEGASLEGPATHFELFSRINDAEGYPEYQLGAGDFIHVNCYDSTGVFGQWTDDEFGHGGQNFETASRIAADSTCSLGVAYGQNPISGFHRYSLFVNPLNPRWYNY